MCFPRTSCSTIQCGSHPHRYQFFESDGGGNRKRVKKEDGKERAFDGSHREGGGYLDDDVSELRVEPDMYFHEYVSTDGPDTRGRKYKFNKIDLWDGPPYLM